MDLGERQDIHPANKQEVGRRLVGEVEIGGAKNAALPLLFVAGFTAPITPSRAYRTSDIET